VPKLANIAVSDPAAVQTITLTNPTPQANAFGPGVINFSCSAGVSAPGSAARDRRRRLRWTLTCFVLEMLLAPPEDFRNGHP
jgi:hypothetical protein